MTKVNQIIHKNRVALCAIGLKIMRKFWHINLLLAKDRKLIENLLNLNDLVFNIH